MAKRALQITGSAVLAAALVAQSAPARADVPHEHLVASFDGLGAVGERYGATLELVVSPHDTFTISGWSAGGASNGTTGLLPGFLSNGSTTYAVQTRAQGIDLQYRRYVLASAPEGKGARGFFFAPGVHASSFITNGFGCTRTYDSDNSSSETTCTPPVRQAWTYLGPSLDVGGQAIFRYGITLGGSVGAHYRFVADGALDENVMPFGWSLSHGSGLGLRLRAWIGFAFL